MKYRCYLLLIVAALALGSAFQVIRARAPSKPPVDPQTKKSYIEYCQSYLSGVDQQIHTWRMNGELQISLTASVILIGCLIGVLAAFAKPDGTGKMQPMRSVIILGALTSAITGINTTFLSGDYGQAASEAILVKSHLYRIYRIEVMNAKTEDDLNQGQKDFNEKSVAYDEIVHRVARTQGHNVGGALVILPHFSCLPVPAAQALTAPPKWTNARPTDSRFLYFVGKSTDTSLAAASSNAKLDATNQALRVFSTGEPYVFNEAWEKQIRGP